MCNKYRMTAKQAEVVARYGIAQPYPKDLTIPPPEMFPKRSTFVVRDAADQRALDVMAWASPRRPPAAGSAPVTNVYNFALPFWRSALATPARRSLVPFTAFSKYGPGEKGKCPLFWFDVPSQPIVSFADIWRPIEAGPVFAFLTSEPHAIVAPIHPKAMPVLLHVQNERAWLTAGWEGAPPLVAPFQTQLMRVG